MKHYKEGDELVIELRLPLTQTGKYTLEEMAGIESGDTWTQPTLGVYINADRCDYALCHMNYLDYKDSLQHADAIVHFDSPTEAVEFAKEYGLSVKYL